MANERAKKAAKEMSSVLNLYKPKGETPLQTIERYVARHPSFEKVKMTYAGRLDPMAEGVLVVLAGEKNKEREAYTGLDKDYEFEFILGIETDTFDILGKITSDNGTGNTKKDEVKKALTKYKGKFVQTYPPFSSKVIDGTPMFELARTGKLDLETLPTHEVEAKEIVLVGTREISKADFKKEVFDSVRAVKGDFRQDETLQLWDMYFERLAPETFIVYKAKVSCGSGFYIRQLVSDLGRDLKIGAVTRSIVRTRVGEFELKDSLK